MDREFNIQFWRIRPGDNKWARYTKELPTCHTVVPLRRCFVRLLYFLISELARISRKNESPHHAGSRRRAAAIRRVDEKTQHILAFVNSSSLLTNAAKRRLKHARAVRCYDDITCFEISHLCSVDHTSFCCSLLIFATRHRRCRGDEGNETASSREKKASHMQKSKSLTAEVKSTIINLTFKTENMRKKISRFNLESWLLTAFAA